MGIPTTLRKGFSFDEAILLATFSQQSYEIFKHDDGCVDDRELEEIYNAVHREQGWKFIHSLRNDETNVRGFIVKRRTEHQYAVVLRGSILSDRGMLEMTDIMSDVDWDMIPYGAMTDRRIKVARGFFDAFSSIADQLEIFFKTLLGQLTLKDFNTIHHLKPARQFACITSLADAGTIRLGQEFGKEIRQIIADIVADQEIGNDGELENALAYLKEHLLCLEEMVVLPEVYVTGHSLGGSLAFFAGLALRRLFGAELSLKLYTFGSAKVGNQAFADYYRRLMGKGFTYRVENVIDSVPKIPLDPPFPFNILAPQGLRMGTFYIGNYVHVGKAHSMLDFGYQKVSVDFGGALEFFGAVPFSHSFDAYVQALEADKKNWETFWQPIEDFLGRYFQDMLQEQEVEMKAHSQKQFRKIQSDLDELKAEVNALRHSMNGKVDSSVVDSAVKVVATVGQPD